MKPPPLLLGATLIFWGVQAGYYQEAVPMALILESSRFIKTRWEFSNDEFARIWTFCMVLFLAAMMFAFSDNGGLTSFGQLFENLNIASESNAGKASTMTADAIIRWLPMIFFLFVAAQAYSPIESVPLEAVSLYLRSRMKKARKRGHTLPPSRRFNVLYPYFALCLFSSSAHSIQADYFYYGLSILLAWALWPFRSRRFSLYLWAIMLAAAIGFGYLGQHLFTQLTRLAGQYDPQIFSFFWRARTDPRETMTNLGEIGLLKLSGKIVIRLEPKNGNPVPSYLREASYRKPGEMNYNDGKELRWDASNTNSDFPQVYETPRDSGIWPLNSTSANHYSVSIACYLNEISQSDKYPEGLLPLPPDCNRLENLRAYFVFQNNIGAVQAEGPHLVIFDARFGSGAILDTPPNAGLADTNLDLLVPPDERAALDKVISHLHVAGNSDEDKIAAVTTYFSTFTYSLWQKEYPRGVGTNNTALGRFLLESHSGHCEYFASATVLLLREMGIPARYAVGYYVHETSGKGYVVRERDAHAWCLIWRQSKHAWETLDTTPGTWVEAEEEHASPFQFLSDFQSWVQFQVLKLFEYGHSNIREYLFWVLIPALMFLLYRIFRSSHRHKKSEEEKEFHDWPGLDSEFYRLEQKLIHNGVPRRPGEPLSAWLQRATNDPRLQELKQPLEKVLHLHYRYRFDPYGLNTSERQALRSEVEACLAAASQSPEK
jgi:protein-glutamine gamma-glutamyltransferase